MKTLFAIAALLAAAAPAAAQEAPRSRTVGIADLDLSRPSDVRKMNARVRAAIAEVCGARPGASVGEEDRYQRCRAATAAAVRKTTVAALRTSQATRLAAR
jgi:UrcA family protein